VSRRFKLQGFLVGANEAPFARWDSSEKNRDQVWSSRSSICRVLSNHAKRKRDGRRMHIRMSRFSIILSRNRSINLFNIKRRIILCKMSRRVV